MSQPLDEKSVGPAEVKNGIVMTLQPAQVMGNIAQDAHFVEIDDTQLRAFSISPATIECLRKFGFNEIPIRSLAQHIGFNTVELELLDIFWEPTFNNSWIYLSPKIVEKDLGYGAIRDFIRDVLQQIMDDPNGGADKVPRYIEGIDYVEVPKTHELVTAYEKFTAEFSAVKKPARKGGIVSKYHLMRGKAFKRMVMRFGKADKFRDYFLKMEDVASLQHEVSNGLIKYSLFLEKQLIAEQQKRITHLEAQTAGLDQRDAILKQFVQDQAVKKITGWLYIGTSQQDLLVNHFKLGITENLETRRDQYTKTFSTRANRFYYCDYFPLHDPKIVENASKVILKSYHLNDKDRTRQDETYIINYGVLHKIISQLCTNHNGVIELVNTLLGTYKDDIYRPSVVIEKALPKALLRIEMTITSDDQSVTIPLDMDEMTEVERVNVCKSIINSYVRNKTQHKTYDIATDEKEAIEPKIEIKADELDKFIKACVPHGKKGKIKLPAVRHAIASILTGIKNINYLKKPKANPTVATVTPSVNPPAMKLLHGSENDQNARASSGITETRANQTTAK